jgi:hypothetical protein
VKWTQAIMVVRIVAALAIYFAISISPSDTLAFATSFVSPDTIAVVAVLGTVVSEEPFIYRDGISPLLKERLGVKLGKSTIAKLFSPAVGQGCEPARYWNKRPLYRPSDVIAWAKSRLRPGPCMAATFAEEMPTDDIPAKGGSDLAARPHHEESESPEPPPRGAVAPPPRRGRPPKLRLAGEADGAQKVRVEAATR